MKQKTITFSQIDEFHKLAPGTAKNCFMVLSAQLEEGTDYINNDDGDKNITLTGYMFLQTMFVGTMYNDAKRKTVHYLASLDESQSPFEIIREQLAALEEESKIGQEMAEASDSVSEKPSRRGKYKVKAPEKEAEHVTVLPPVGRPGENATVRTPSPKYPYNAKAMKKNKADISDPVADDFIKDMNFRLRAIVVREGLASYTATLRRIYTKMTSVYGFVADQAKKECRAEYGLTENPSVLRAIAENETWREIFGNIISDIEKNGYYAVMAA